MDIVNKANNFFLVLSVVVFAIVVYLTSTKILPVSSAIIIAVALLSILSVLFAKKIPYSTKPNIVVSIGIAGTFLGICISLFHFNPDTIEESINEFLGGMQTAFWTSVIGIIFSILLKLPHIQNFFLNDDKKPEEDSEDIIDLLRGIKKGIEDNTTFEKLYIKLENIEKALVGDGDNTLLSVMKNLKSDVHDDFKTVKESLEKAIETLSKGATEVIINALKDVIQDFNNNLQEQFGENFKQLNEAVIKLVTWQENYKEIVEQSQEAHQNFIQQSQENYREISKKSQQYFAEMSDKLNNFMDQAKEFSNVSSTLQNLLVKLHEENQKIEFLMSGFAELTDKAREGFPIIKENIEHITTSLKNNFDILDKDLSHFTQEFKNRSDEIATNIAKANQDLNQNLTKELNAFTRDINSQAKKMLDDNSKTITNQIGQLDEALGRTLNQSLNTLGRQLISISEHFVKNWEALKNKINELERILK